MAGKRCLIGDEGKMSEVMKGGGDGGNRKKWLAKMFNRRFSLNTNSMDSDIPRKAGIDKI